MACSPWQIEILVLALTAPFNTPANADVMLSILFSADACFLCPRTYLGGLCSLLLAFVDPRPSIFKCWTNASQRNANKRPAVTNYGSGHYGKPAAMLEAAGRYMHTHEQKRQRIHEYDDNDSDGNDNDDNDYTTTTTNTLCMIPNINTSEDKHDDVDHDDDDHSNVDGDGDFDCTSAPCGVEFSYEAACND